MAGFADVEGTQIIVFYPKNGVSKVQELQMRTQKGANVDVVAIHGNFDNAQSGVKQMFEDQELAKNWLIRDTSSHQQTPSISDVLYHRSLIMYMHIQNCLQMERLKTARRLM